MHLLYLDDSGSVGNAADKHVILAGLSVFERQPHWLSLQLDRLAADIWPSEPEALEFRGVDMLSGRKHWRGVPRSEREQAYRTVLSTLTSRDQIRLFGAAIHKGSVSPLDPMEQAFEQVCSRFDKYLGRRHRQSDTQRGLIILDKSAYETSLQGLANNFRKRGYQWGRLNNLSEVPLFVDSKASRMIQYADLIAHAIRRYYDGGDATYFDLIARQFDTEGDVLHGLVHRRPKDMACPCFACKAR